MLFLMEREKQPGHKISFPLRNSDIKLGSFYIVWYGVMVWVCCMYDVCKDNDMFDIISGIFVTEICEAWRTKNMTRVMFSAISLCNYMQNGGSKGIGN